MFVSYFLIAVRREQSKHYIKTKMHNIHAWAMYAELKNSRLVSAVKLRSELAIGPYSISFELAVGIVSCTGLIVLEIIRFSESPCVRVYSPLGVTIKTMDSLLSVT